VNAGAPQTRSPWRRAGLLGAACLAAYLATGQSLPGNDATSNVHLSLQLLDHHSLFFTADENPKMFSFAVESPEGTKRGRIRDWTQVTYQGRPAREAYDRGELRVQEPIYYLVPTVHPKKYANTFGLGAGLFALPIVAPVRLFVSDLGNRLGLLWWLTKLAAALSVAGAVVFVFLGARRFMSDRMATLIALAYGLGTCAFSISSQALWQHGPCELFLAMSAYFLLAKGHWRSDFLCGLGAALAVLCRPTAGVLVVCVGVSLLISDRRRLIGFVLGGMPILAALCAYNQYAFAAPLSFGQIETGAAVAAEKTGSPNVWQTPLWLGMAGLLFSPGRGLFVYTPLALFSLWGIGRAFRAPAWKELRPLAVATFLLLVLASKWFDWWGGWCFGYRPIVDVVILLTFLSFPVADLVARKRTLQAVFAVLFVYSFGVQILGAFAYDVSGWNGRTIWEAIPTGQTKGVAFIDQQAAARSIREQGGKLEPKEASVDKPEHRHRLWSVTDSPLVYYFETFSESRAIRLKSIEEFLPDDG